MRFKKIIAALLSAALLLSLCACGETDETKIAVIVKSVDSDFWQNFKSGVESAATEYNVSSARFTVILISPSSISSMP